MYPVSEAFLRAVQENTRRYYWTGKITTKAGVVHEFSEKDIVKGSGYISFQCCGNTEMELGSVYAAEMGITLFSEIDRYTLEDALVELYYHLLVGDMYETVPMGIMKSVRRTEPYGVWRLRPMTICSGLKKISIQRIR